MTADSFIARVKLDRTRVGYGNQAISQGFIFAYHREFPETGSEFFKSVDNDKLIDEELFILEVASNKAFDLQESIDLLARFFCGIQVFESKKNLGRNELQCLLSKDLSVYVTDKMLNEKIEYVNQILKLD